MQYNKTIAYNDFKIEKIYIYLIKNAYNIFYVFDLAIWLGVK